MCCNKPKIVDRERAWWEVAPLQDGSVATFRTEEEARQYLLQPIESLQAGRARWIYQRLNYQRELAEGG